MCLRRGREGLSLENAGIEPLLSLLYAYARITYNNYYSNRAVDTATL